MRLEIIILLIACVHHYDAKNVTNEDIAMVVHRLVGDVALLQEQSAEQTKWMQKEDETIKAVESSVALLTQVTTILQRTYVNLDTSVKDIQRKSSIQENRISKIEAKSADEGKRISDVEKKASKEEIAIAALKKIAGEEAKKVADLEEKIKDGNVTHIVHQMSELKKKASTLEKNTIDLAKRTSIIEEAQDYRTANGVQFLGSLAYHSQYGDDQFKDGVDTLADCIAWCRKNRQEAGGHKWETCMYNPTWNPKRCINRDNAHGTWKDQSPGWETFRFI